MRREVLIVLTLACLTVLGAVIVGRTVSAQGNAQAKGQEKKETPPAQKHFFDEQNSSSKGEKIKLPPKPTPSPSPYNPYPPGILPADIESELARVLREVDVIEARAIARFQALPPPNLTGQPPTFQGSGTEMIETLGELMNYDKNMSPNRNEACNSCHMPYVAFSGPIPSVNLTMIAYPGTEHFRANKRTAQRYTYSPTFPVLDYNAVQGLFFGGNFWDARSTGYLLQSPDAEQAQHPPVDPGEMGFPDTACIAYRLSQAEYRPLFEAVWGAGSF